MADSANIEYSGSVTVKETLEASDPSNTVSLIHSQVDKTLDGNFNFDLSDVSEFSIVTGYPITSVAVDIDFTTGYDGMTAASETSVDFFFAKIESALSTDTPDAAFKFGNQNLFRPQLKGVGDFCIVPMWNYNMGTTNYDIKVYSTLWTTICNVTVLIANRD